MMRRIELLPESYLRRRRERRTLATVVLAGGLAVLLLVGWWVLLKVQTSSANDDLQAARARNAALQSQIAELEQFAQMARDIQRKKTALASVFEGDVDWPAVMTEVAMVVPGEVWLTEMAGSAGLTEGATPAGTETAPVVINRKTPAFGRIQFTGESLSMPGVAKFLIRVNSLKDFDAAWLNGATENTSFQGGPRVFDTDLTLELNEKAGSNRFQNGSTP
jgi:Tfp pilus assembly protein PilN